MKQGKVSTWLSFTYCFFTTKKGRVLISIAIATQKAPLVVPPRGASRH